MHNVTARFGQALKRLNGSDRDLLLWSYRDGLDHTSAIAARLSLEPGAVRVRRHRALQRLREALRVISSPQSATLIREDVAEEITCAEVENRDLVSGYVLKYTLSEADAATFERHYLGCPRCWEELKLATDVRSATTDSAAAAAGPRSKSAFYLVVPFAAAAMVMLSVIVWQRGRIQDQTDPVRTSSSDQLQVEAASDASSLRMRWSPVAGAMRYRLVLSAADGTPVLRREAGETQIEVPRSQLASRLFNAPCRRRGIRCAWESACEQFATDCQAAGTVALSIQPPAVSVCRAYLKNWRVP